MQERGVTRREVLGAAGAAGIGAVALAEDAPKSDNNPQDKHRVKPKEPLDSSRDKTIFTIDPDKRMEEQRVVGHNRWHPDIPPVAEVSPGDTFFVECQEWTDLQIHNTDSADDVRDVDLDVVHVLSGPFRVKGAEPGDLLAVDILDIGPLRHWGYTGIFAKKNGGGFLTDEFPDAHKAIWDFHGIYATSRHVPGVRFVGISHPGLISTAPSQKELDRWNRREAALIATDPDRVPPLALPPEPRSALAGLAKGAVRDKVGREGARTVPPRENGGNMDVKNLTRGSRVYLPVYVDGANLSIGDLHFSQGDGEITYCGAIEMAGWVHLGVELIKGGMAKYQQTAPIIRSSPLEPRYSEYLLFEGISVDHKTDTQHYLDAKLAYKNACLNAIRYLSKATALTPAQVYLLLGAAPIEGRIGGIVDVPNACCTVGVPIEIFDKKILPV